MQLYHLHGPEYHGRDDLERGFNRRNAKTWGVFSAKKIIQLTVMDHSHMRCGR